MAKHILLLAVAFLLSTTGSLLAEVRVIDGDTIDVAGERIRLWGIDAPEGAQRCTHDGAAYDCGHNATEALVAILGGLEPTCEPRDRDRYGRTVAVCRARGIDIGAEMVRQGWALDYGRYSHGAYEHQEREAKAAHRGVWAGQVQPPWEWRREQRGGK